jgi:hypothetical protein
MTRPEQLHSYSYAVRVRGCPCLSNGAVVCVLVLQLGSLQHLFAAWCRLFSFPAYLNCLVLGLTSVVSRASCRVRVSCRARRVAPPLELEVFVVTRPGVRLFIIIKITLHQTRRAPLMIHRTQQMNIACTTILYMTTCIVL